MSTAIGLSSRLPWHPSSLTPDFVTNNLTTINHWINVETNSYTVRDQFKFRRAYTDSIARHNRLLLRLNLCPLPVEVEVKVEVKFVTIAERSATWETTRQKTATSDLTSTEFVDCDTNLIYQLLLCLGADVFKQISLHEWLKRMNRTQITVFKMTEAGSIVLKRSLLTSLTLQEGGFEDFESIALLFEWCVKWKKGKYLHMVLAKAYNYQLGLYGFN